MNVTESNAVFVLLEWMGHRTVGSREVPADERVIDAVVLLGERAGKTLMITQAAPDLAETAERFLGRLAAADSDGAAQAVCRSLATHVSHGGSIPWPTVRRPLEEWQQMKEAAS